MEKDLIYIEPFDEAGDAAYRVYASTRELLFAGCGLVLSDLILPFAREGAGVSKLPERRDPECGVTVVEPYDETLPDRIMEAVPGASLAERSFALSSTDIDLLLVDFLTELMYLFDSDSFLGHDFELEFAEPDGGVDLHDADSNIHVNVDVHGVILPVMVLEPANPEDRILGLVPKGASYHMLQVGQREDGRWSAQFVLDA